MESLKFGTSGLRGLATDLVGGAARRYTAAFLKHLRTPAGVRVYLGSDLRASSAAIVEDCAVAIRAAGLVPVDCGTLPTPALALHAMANGSAAIMVTGSHIPADRNGLKFYTAAGEITKADVAGVVAALGETVPAGEGRPINESARAGDRSPAIVEPHGRTISWDLLVRRVHELAVGLVDHGRCDEDRADFCRVREQSCFAHCGCWLKSTGVSSKTSSFDVLCGHGITSRQRNGPIRSRTPAMSRLGSSP